MGLKQPFTFVVFIGQLFLARGRIVTGGLEPDAYRSVPKLITSKGYPCEEHWAVTKDGYILNIIRIPPTPSAAGRIAPVAFLQHGLLADSNNWVTNHANQSLGFMLHDAGYDVWMGNSRGSYYSRNHTKLDPNKLDFWKFSWDEMATYDFPANLRYVLNATKQQSLYYISHSQGTLQAFAALGRWPELQKMVKIFFALGPVTNLKYIKSPVKYLEPFADKLELLWEILGHGEFLRLYPQLMATLSEYACQDLDEIICSNVLFLLGGYDRQQMNETRIPVYVTHNPSGTSIQNMAHYAQAVKNGNFQQFDFGPEGNMKKYNQTSPPKWDASPIKTPVALFWGENDWLADPRDVKEFLLPVLSNIIHGKDGPIPGWEHLDFVWGVNATIVCYRPIIKIMDQHEDIAVKRN